MRLQTRLFLGTAVLVLALMAAQWWLHLRQLRTVEAELGAVAASVGKDMLAFGPDIALAAPAVGEQGMLWVDEGCEIAEEGNQAVRRNVHVMVIPEGEEAEITHKVTRRISLDPNDREVRSELEVRADIIKMDVDGDLDAVTEFLGEEHQNRYVLQVVADEDAEESVLVIHGDAGLHRRIPIPVEPAVESFQSSMKRGAAVGGLLLVIGLVGAGVLANRVTRPLRGLADGAEAVGRGELGIQVPVTAVGEVGELQRAFNGMSARLAELEAERDQWREREHLAQLGDVSRGLAHTLRNPLNTLGLAVEELAAKDEGSDDLVFTARSQIRRIDQWLRSFLALGAEDAAEPTPEDLGDLSRAVVFEAVQQGARVQLDGGDDPVPVVAVASAVRAALANLLENATDVTPPGTSVEVEVLREQELGVVTIRDGGPGLPDDVRARLFEPHVTTKVGGSGMGLFLARQLVVGMHGGILDVEDHPDGGTIAIVKLPLQIMEGRPVG